MQTTVTYVYVLDMDNVPMDLPFEEIKDYAIKNGLKLTLLEFEHSFNSGITVNQSNQNIYFKEEKITVKKH